MWLKRMFKVVAHYLQQRGLLESFVKAELLRSDTRPKALALLPHSCIILKRGNIEKLLLQCVEEILTCMVSCRRLLM